MKLILGAAASALLLIGACGSDGESGEIRGNAGSANNEGGAAGSDGTVAGEGGTAVQTPNTGGGEGGAGGVDAGGAATSGSGPAEAGAGGQGGAAGEALVDVSGHVRTFQGSPLADAVVLINDVSVITDAAGAFTIPDVTESYDLTIIDNVHKFVEIVEGLTTRTPDVAVWQLRLPTRIGAVAGKLSGGGGFPLPAGQAGLVAFHGDKSSYLQTNLVAAASSFTVSQIKWEGGTTCAGSLTGIFWKQALTGPSEYTGFGTRAVTRAAQPRTRSRLGGGSRGRPIHRSRCHRRFLDRYR